jgi:3-isopropylmalate dehydrogenase
VRSAGRDFEKDTMKITRRGAERVAVAAVALVRVQRPDSFDVMVTENMFGDILSPLGASIIGGVGLAPSANLGETYSVRPPVPRQRTHPRGPRPRQSPRHHSLQRDAAGRPGHPEPLRGARLIPRAVALVLANPHNRTADLGGRISTPKMCLLVCQALTSSAPCSP